MQVFWTTQKSQNQVSDYKSKGGGFLGFLGGFFCLFVCLFSFVFDPFRICSISSVPGRAFCEMIGTNVSSSVLIQIRAEVSASLCLVGTNKPFGCTVKTSFCSAGTGIDKIMHLPRPIARSCFKSWPLILVLYSVAVSQGSSQGHGDDILAHEQSYADLLCMARTAGKGCDCKVVCQLLDPTRAL